MAITSISTCTLWADYRTGLTQTTIPNVTGARADDIECIEWTLLESGTQNIRIQQVNPNLTNPLPTTLLGTDNRVFIDSLALGLVFPVEEQNPVQGNSGVQLVQLDPNFYPIPVIDQGTAPQEVTFASGSTLNANFAGSMDMSDQFKNSLQDVNFVTLAVFLTLFSTIVLYWFFGKLGFSFLKKRLW